MLNVLLVVEGNEEEAFFDIVKEKGVKAEAINLSITNAKGALNIPPLFQDALSNDRYDAIFCVYDVDGRQKEQDSPFCRVRNSLKAVLGSIQAVESISLCTNPNILLFYLLGPAKPAEIRGKLVPSKTANTNLLHAYWDEIGRNPEKKYNAASWQLKLMKYSYEDVYS